MKVALLAEAFTPTMGYTENFLPKALARLGVEMHVVATDLQVYYNDPNYRQTYEAFNGPAVQPCGSQEIDGITLHRLPHAMRFGYARIRGLARKLRELHIDVVQTQAAASWLPIEAALAQPLLGYRLFTGAHQTASVMDPRLKTGSRWSVLRLHSDFRRAIPGRLVSKVSVKCYAATVDCAEVACTYYGVERKKVEVCPLGVNTWSFCPAKSEAEQESRMRLRAEMGSAPDDLVFLYTGRFSAEKNPQCLAEAVARLRRHGRRVWGWFVGAGPQGDAIASMDGCRVHAFVQNRELPDFYRAADVGVWPTQESMSMLDAAACGLPVVVSDRLQALERIEGNGLQYHEGDAVDLMRVLDQLQDASLRRSLGAAGADKVVRLFSWDNIARKRLSDYQASLDRKTHP